MAGLKGILQEASSDIELARRQQLAQYIIAPPLAITLLIDITLSQIGPVGRD